MSYEWGRAPEAGRWQRAMPVWLMSVIVIAVGAGIVVWLVRQTFVWTPLQQFYLSAYTLPAARRTRARRACPRQPEPTRRAIPHRASSFQVVRAHFETFTESEEFFLLPLVFAFLILQRRSENRSLELPRIR